VRHFPSKSYRIPVFDAVGLGSLLVTLRRGPSDFGYDPMVSPTLCPTLSTALKSKFCLPPMAFVVGIGRLRTSCALSRRVLSATGKRLRPLRLVEGARGCELLRCLIFQAAVRALCVIVVSPVLDDFSGLKDAGEPVLVQAFLAVSPVDAGAMREMGDGV